MGLGSSSGLIISSLEALFKLHPNIHGMQGRHMARLPCSKMTYIVEDGLEKKRIGGREISLRTGKKPCFISSNGVNMADIHGVIHDDLCEKVVTGSALFLLHAHDLQYAESFPAWYHFTCCLLHMLTSANSN